MSNQMNRIIIILLIFIAVGCSKSFDIQLEPEVSLYLNSDNKQRISLTEKDEAYVELKKWLNENKANWYVTSGRYPGGVYVKSGKHGIQVTERQVVIYSTANNETKAIYIQDIGNSELNIIKGFAK